jgi:hypothetical protein
MDAGDLVLVLLSSAGWWLFGALMLLTLIGS